MIGIGEAYSSAAHAPTPDSQTIFRASSTPWSGTMSLEGLLQLLDSWARLAMRSPKSRTLGLVARKLPNGL